jgi:hypothetical protein
MPLILISHSDVPLQSRQGKSRMVCCVIACGQTHQQKVPANSEMGTAQERRLRAWKVCSSIHVLPGTRAMPKHINPDRGPGLLIFRPYRTSKFQILPFVHWSCVIAWAVCTNNGGSLIVSNLK